MKRVFGIVSFLMLVLGLGSSPVWADHSRIQAYEVKCIPTEGPDLGPSQLKVKRGCSGNVTAYWQGISTPGCDVQYGDVNEWISDGETRIQIRLNQRATLRIPPEWFIRSLMDNYVFAELDDEDEFGEPNHGYIPVDGTLTSVSGESTVQYCLIRYLQCGAVSGGNH